MKKLLTLVLALPLLAACSTQAKPAASPAPYAGFAAQMKIVNENIATYESVSETADYQAGKVHEVKDAQGLRAAIDVIESHTLSDAQTKTFAAAMKKLPQEYQDLTKAYSVKVDGKTVSAKYFKLTNIDNQKFSLSLDMAQYPEVKSVSFKTWTSLEGQDDLANRVTSYNAAKKQWTSTFVLRDGNWDGTVLDFEADITTDQGKNVKLASSEDPNIPVASLTQLVDHRGNTKNAPENSIPAFDAVKYWGTETDTMLTKDGQWVIMHDATVNRMTNGKGDVSSYTLAELRKLVLNSQGKTVANKAELVVPTFKQYLQICSEKGITPVIEIKTDAATDADFVTLAKDVASLDMSRKMFAISFYSDMLAKFSAAFPGTNTMLLVGSITPANIATAKAISINSGLDPNYLSVTAAQVQEMHAAGLWVGVNTVPKADWAKMRAMGVDSITTND